tara:strand:- start:240 stop:401 length:162 start_codon:yes stop_codon:yes gene_type:complete
MSKDYSKRKRTLLIVKILKRFENANLHSLGARKRIAEEIVAELEKDFKIERGL